MVILLNLATIMPLFHWLCFVEMNDYALHKRFDCKFSTILSTTFHVANNRIIMHSLLLFVLQNDDQQTLFVANLWILHICWLFALDSVYLCPVQLSYWYFMNKNYSQVGNTAQHSARVSHKIVWNWTYIINIRFSWVKLSAFSYAHSMVSSVSVCAPFELYDLLF